MTNIEKIFKQILRESLESENENNFEQQYDDKNKDGKSIDFQAAAKEPKVNEYGCYLYSLVNGSGTDPRKTDELYDKFRKEGKINDNCLVQDPAGIASELDPEHDYDFQNQIILTQMLILLSLVSTMEPMTTLSRWMALKRMMYHLTAMVIHIQ